MKKLIIILLLAICNLVFAVGFSHPIALNNGNVIFSGYNGSDIYIFNDLLGNTVTYNGFRGRNLDISTQGISTKHITKDGITPVILSGYNENHIALPSKDCGCGKWFDSKLFIPSNGTLFSYDNQVLKDEFELFSNVHYINISDNGLIAYTGDCNEVYIQDLNGNLISKIPNAGAKPVFSKCNSQIIASLGNVTKIFDIYTGQLISEISDSRNPEPFANGVIFTRLNENNYKIISSDLFYFDINALKTHKLTLSKNIYEDHASVSGNGKYIAYRNAETGDIFRSEISIDNFLIENTVLIAKGSEFVNSVELLSPMETFEVTLPYLHQVYDTPDWYNGHWSCGPSSCLMTVQKYDILPSVPITCSMPETHTHDFGWYIPNEYTFNGYTYDIEGLGAGDAWAPGAHGFICREYGGAVSAYMEDFLQQHTVTCWQEAISFERYSDNIDSDYPMVVSTYVMTYGHIQAFKGYFGNHGIIANDPYGNANYSPWCQYNGEGAMYDWQGYDNGYLEITVRQLLSAQSPYALPSEAAPDTIVDECSSGATVGGPMEYWRSYWDGYDNHFYWTRTMEEGDDSNFMRWVPNLPQKGVYELFAYFPDAYAQANIDYDITHLMNTTTVTINQADYNYEWASLGTYSFEDKDGGFVYMGDVTGTGSIFMTADALKWSYRSALPASDTLVDDGQNGFDREGSVFFWKQGFGGHGSHYYWTYSTNAADTCYCSWTPELESSGNYEVFVYIPGENAQTTNATYHINHRYGEDIAYVNQSSYSDEWVSIGTYPFSNSTSTSVYLGDATGTAGQKIAFDAIKWHYISELDIVEENIPGSFSSAVYPNPFNSICNINVESNAELSIFDISGKLIEHFDSETANRVVQFDGSKLSSGVYIVQKLTNNNIVSGYIYLLK